MEPFIAGGTGSQSDLLKMPTCLPDKYESGTMNLPGIVGLHAALSYLAKTGIDLLREKKMELTGYFLDRVKELDGVRIVGRPDLKSRVAVVSLDFLKMDNAVTAFDEEADHDAGGAPLCTAGSSVFWYISKRDGAVCIQRLQYQKGDRYLYRSYERTSGR